MSLPRRQTPPFERVWSYQRPAGVLLLISMLAGWGAAQGILSLLDITAMRDQLVLDGTGIRASEYWRFFTYQFLHANLLHFVLTAGVLFITGREVEPIIGRRHVLGLCLGANLVGGVVAWSVQPEYGIYGASAAAAAMLAAYATILPELEYRLRLFWLLPVQFRMRHVVGVLSVGAGLCVGTHSLPEIGPAAILAGVVFGWLWSRFLGFGRLFWFQRAAYDRDALERRRERMSAEEFISAEIDPILEKIARTGMGSLSRDERRLLKRAKDKIETPQK